MRCSVAARLCALFRYGAIALVVNVCLGAGPGAAWAAARPVRLLVLGDSLTAGWGLPVDAAFPAQLQRALAASGRPVEVLDGGVSGDTSADGLARLDWALADHPDAVMVELGANDALRGLDPAGTYANLDAILARLQRARLPTLLAGMLAPPNLGKDYGDRFAAIYPRLAKAHPVVFYPFFLDGAAAVPSLTQHDGMHPNQAGVAVIVRRILPAVTRLLDRTGEVRP